MNLTRKQIEKIRNDDGINLCDTQNLIPALLDMAETLLEVERACRARSSTVLGESYRAGVHGACKDVLRIINGEARQ